MFWKFQDTVPLTDFEENCNLFENFSEVHTLIQKLHFT